MELLDTTVRSVAALVPWGVGTAVACGTMGAAAMPLAAIVAGALVPSAMAYFGSIAYGVGTLRAAGGIAATLQYTAATYTSANAAAMGGVAGVATGMMVEVVRLLFGEETGAPTCKFESTAGTTLNAVRHWFGFSSMTEDTWECTLKSTTARWVGVTGTSIVEDTWQFTCAPIVRWWFGY